MSDIKPWPLFGYAPGGYLIQCQKCETNHHTGDKRAIICGACAAVEAKSRIEALERENAELRKERGGLAAALNWIEAPFVDADTPVEELRKRVSLAAADAARAFAMSASALKPAEEKGRGE